MAIKNSVKAEGEAKYLSFLKRRLQTSNYHAEEKLKRIDELAEIIFVARENYRRQTKS